MVVATDKGYLRFLTGSGVQKYIWRMGEEVITMVGGKKEVLVVSREGGTSLDGEFGVLSFSSTRLNEQGDEELI